MSGHCHQWNTNKRQRTTEDNTITRTMNLLNQDIWREVVNTEDPLQANALAN